MTRIRIFSLGLHVVLSDGLRQLGVPSHGASERNLLSAHHDGSLSRAVALNDSNVIIIKRTLSRNIGSHCIERNKCLTYPIAARATRKEPRPAATLQIRIEWNKYRERPASITPLAMQRRQACAPNMLSSGIWEHLDTWELQSLVMSLLSQTKA